MMSITKAELIAKIIANNPGRNWNQACQALMWQATLAGAGSAPVVYPSAIAAYRASAIVSTDASKAQPGDIHYWSIGTFGHDGMELGGGLMLHTSTLATNTETHGKFLFTGRVSSYQGKYLGFSSQNGKNPHIPLSFTQGIRYGSLLTLEQALALAGWLGRIYNSKSYWTDLQTQGKWNGVYAGKVDGDPGKLTFAAEKALWQKYLAPVPPASLPPVVIVPAEPEPPVIVEPEPEQPTPPVVPEPAPPIVDTPNWFLRFLKAIIEALTTFLGGKSGG